MFHFAIVDDIHMVRYGLKKILLETFHDATVDEFTRGCDFIGNARNNHYDLALLEISLPDISGIEVRQTG